ncbi:MAG: protein kinase [Myxococcaceae bacterium]|nr:protein kinase [Myxococcaceae bacterium]
MTRLAGKYELVRLLGRGGMAEVWEAVAHGEAGFRRRVAIKRVALEHAGDERLAGLFVDEARVSSALHHPGVVAVVDFGVDGGVAFQVMELVEGVDAGRLGEVSLPLALAITARVGRALHAAHTAVDELGAPLNVVHRDVSPQNVLLSRRGEVKLSDFGIARWKHRTERTLAGASRGKPSYMAPEQATKGDVDARADVFSLGCTLHALCTGRSPLADENALVDLLAGVPLPVSRELPEPVRALIARAVERDRHARFPTAVAFAEACEVTGERLAPGFGVEAAIASLVEAVLPARVVVATPVEGPSVTEKASASNNASTERGAALGDAASAQSGASTEPDSASGKGASAQNGASTERGAALGEAASAQSGASTEPDSASGKGASAQNAASPEPGTVSAKAASVQNGASTENGSVSGEGASAPNAASTEPGTVSAEAASAQNGASTENGSVSGEGASAPNAASTGNGSAYGRDTQSAPLARTGPQHERAEVPAPAAAGSSAFSPPKPPRRRLWPAVLGVLSLVAGLGGLGLAISRPPEPVPVDDDLAFEPIDGDRRAVVTRPVLVASAAPQPPPVRATPTVKSEPRQPPRLGVIAVGGQRFVRGEVFVDGKSVGFAPRQLEVSVGLHPVEVVLPDGQRVGPRVLSVGAHHTELAPLRWVED